MEVAPASAFASDHRKSRENEKDAGLADVNAIVRRDFFMLQYRREPDSRRAPVKEFEAAMDALCRAFGAAGPSGASATTTTEECGREAAERAHKYGPQLDATTFLRRSQGTGALGQGR
jgi:hypothetical protein